MLKLLIATIICMFVFDDLLLTTKTLGTIRNKIKCTKIVGKSKVTKKICLTPACVHTASSILKNMDPDVKPCNDFYKYACGKFLKTTIIPDDKDRVNTFSTIADQLREQLRQSIEANSTSDEAKPFRLVKSLYKACMNKTAIEERGLEPLHDILRKLGGWPVIDGDKWNDRDFDWKNTIYKFREMGYSSDYFIDFSIIGDMKNNTRRVIDLDQGTLGLNRKYFMKGFEEKIVVAYYDYMVDVAVILGADRKRAKKELKDSLMFEIKLANISLPVEKRRNATQLYNPMTVAELLQNYSSIPWKEYINRLLPASIRVDENEITIVKVPSYISGLEKIMAETPKRTQANYMMWRIAATSVSYLNEEIRKRELEFLTIFNGLTERGSRWKECVDFVSNRLPMSVGAMYVREFFNEDAKKNALAMVSDIREVFVDNLQKVDWMDNVTKENALKKAAAMSSYIAYPDELLNNQKLEEFYAKLEISENNYIESALNLTIFATDFAFNKLRKPVNKSDWTDHASPAVVNAFYSPTENSIEFPAGILQGAFFNNDRPRYMNYGAIGFVIGHEITHGFDDIGRQFDKDGNLADWWQSKTKENYLKRAECIIHQYGNYTVEEVGMKVNGINTQGENIADNGGIKAAYLAYNRWVKRNGEEPVLPGIKRSPKQLFWISAANVWCAKLKPEALKLRITTGIHSPGEFRILGSLSNTKEFAKDFNCPDGSKMNPVNKCSVW